MTADSTARSHELSTIRSLGAHSQGRLCSKFTVELLDDFIHQGPNGSHQCLVFELLGPTLDKVISDYYEFKDPLEPETILRLSEQLLQAVVFLHEAGYVHGDISTRNIAFTCNGLSRMTEECLFDIVGSPESEELARLDGKPLSEALPSQLVKAADWTNWIDEDDEDLRILDLGEAFLQGAEIKMLAQPGSLQAPETIFTSVIDHRLDLWRTGIVVYSLVFGCLPFWYLGDLDVLVIQMIEFVEQLPTEWQQQWDHIRLNCRHPREPLIMEDQPSPSKLKLKFDDIVQEETLKPILPVIQGLMRLRPSDRISASQALVLIRSIIVEAQMMEDARDGMHD